jgi:hypothetical protein
MEKKKICRWVLSVCTQAEKEQIYSMHSFTPEKNYLSIKDPKQDQIPSFPNQINALVGPDFFSDTDLQLVYEM